MEIIIKDKIKNLMEILIYKRDYYMIYIKFILWKL